MAAIGPSWATDAWVEAGWIVGAWGEFVPAVVAVDESLPGWFGPETQKDYLRRKYKDQFEDGQRREEEADRVPVMEPEIVTGIVEVPDPTPPPPRTARMDAALALSTSRLAGNLGLSRRQRAAKRRREEDDKFILLM